MENIINGAILKSISLESKKNLAEELKLARKILEQPSIYVDPSPIEEIYRRVVQDYGLACAYMLTPEKNRARRVISDLKTEMWNLGLPTQLYDLSAFPRRR